MANPFGFRASRHLNGSNNFSTNTFVTSALTDLWQGQLVILGSGGKVQEATSTTTTPILGVVKACYAGTKNRPLTHNLPATGNYIQSGTSAFVEVYTDPDIIFEVVADSAASAGRIGMVGPIVATGSGNPATGVSRQQIDTSLFAAFASAQTADPLMMVGLGKREESKIGSGYSDQNIVEVVINNHIFRPKVIAGA
jgi:hypothetical protein